MTTPRAPHLADPEDVALLTSMVGRTIVRSEWRTHRQFAENWGSGAYFMLWLDDGSIIRFDASGYDASDATIEAAIVVQVDHCPRCGQPHADLEAEVSDATGAQHPTYPESFVPAGTAYAYCPGIVAPTDPGPVHPPSHYPYAWVGDPQAVAGEA